MTVDPVRSGAEYADAWAKLLPTGPAWPKQPDSVLSQVVAGLAAIWGDVDARAHGLRDVEAFPNTAAELIEEWERVVGLPEHCSGDAAFDDNGQPIPRDGFIPGGGIPFRAGRSRAGARPWRDADRFDELMDVMARRFGVHDDVAPQVEGTLADRRTAVVAKLTREGGQSRAYFLAIAEAHGYEDAEIREFSPFRCGRSRCGSGRWRTGSPLYRYYWRMYVGAAPITWFRCGKSRCGRDPQARITRAVELECIVNQWKPGHTKVRFLYSKISEA